MAATLQVDPELGRELFRCRPRSVWSWRVAKNQGILPAPKYFRFLLKASQITSPILNAFLLAGIPWALLVFVFQVILGFKPPNEPSWVRPFLLANLALAVPVGIWWYWVAPRRDCLVMHERGFRWRLWAHRCALPAKGRVIASSLKGFTRRSDCFATEPTDVGKSTGEKTVRLWLEANVSQHALICHFTTAQELVFDDLFLRFDREDLRRFLAHLAKEVDELIIPVGDASSTLKQAPAES